MCKILEKFIDRRLRWFLEKTNYLSLHQNEFRKNKSTYNNLHDIQNYAIETFETKPVLGLVALDLAKTDDTTWRPRIIQKLRKMMCESNMLNFIKNFLLDRTFQVKVNGHLSQVFKQENGVPQGCTLSVSLFLVAINDTFVKKSNPREIITFRR